MVKPTVFLSHSSKDSQTLAKLKAKLEKTTSGTIDFFLSSDGESIPFGRNWVATLQDALERTKVCFVFLTANSATSSWIYFEAGFIYSKKIRVVPVAMPGVDLGKIPPPIGLLQGFNIHSHESLNNLLRILNDEFGTKFVDSFGVTDFEELFSTSMPTELGYFGRWADYLNQISIRAKTGSSSLPVMEELLQRCGLEYAVSPDDPPSQNTRKSVTTYGLELYETLSAKKELEIQLKVSPDIPSTTLRLVDELLVRAAAVRPISVHIEFAKGMSLLSPSFKISSRLHQHSVRIDKTGSYIYEGIKFSLEGSSSGQRLRSHWLSLPRGTSIQASVDVDLKDSKLHDLVGLLLQREVIQPDFSPEEVMDID